MDFSASATQSWVTVSPANGTLAGGASTTVTVSINSNANSLAAGSYSDTVTFTNLTNGTGDTTRSVNLTVSSTSTAGPISGTPATGFTSSGPVGGPFNPPTATYTVTNLGTLPVDFAAYGTQPWTTVTPGFTTIAGGASITVTVSINSNANTLPAGTYTDTITFENVTNGGGNTTRSVTLTVGSSSDTQPPTVTIVNPAPPTATVTSSPVTITGTAADNVAVTGVTWANAATGGSGPASGTTNWTAVVPLASGSNLITITAYDAAGNSGQATITITYTPSSGDTTPPSVQINSPTTAPTWTTGSSSVALAGVASDNVAVATVTWSNAATGQSGTASGTTSWTATVTLAPGANPITVSAFDTSGNSATDTITVTYSAGGGGGGGGAPPSKDSANGDGSVNDSLCGGSIPGEGWIWILPALALLALLRRR
jgi:hypothetical protein